MPKLTPPPTPLEEWTDLLHGKCTAEQASQLFECPAWQMPDWLVTSKHLVVHDHADWRGEQRFRTVQVSSLRAARAWVKKERPHLLEVFDAASALARMTNPEGLEPVYEPPQMVLIGRIGHLRAQTAFVANEPDDGEDD